MITDFRQMQGKMFIQGTKSFCHLKFSTKDLTTEKMLEIRAEFLKRSIFLRIFLYFFLTLRSSDLFLK